MASENQQFAYAKAKTQISYAVTAQLISAFVFAIVTYNAIPLLLVSKISSFSAKPASVTIQTDFCQTWLETQIVGFLVQRLNHNEGFDAQVDNLSCNQRGKKRERS